jgi:hypothetical protein
VRAVEVGLVVVRPQSHTAKSSGWRCDAPDVTNVRTYVSFRNSLMLQMCKSLKRKLANVTENLPKPEYHHR